jgi:hypothetical protein
VRRHFKNGGVFEIVEMIKRVSKCTDDVYVRVEIC